MKVIFLLQFLLQSPNGEHMLLEHKDYFDTNSACMKMLHKKVDKLRVFYPQGKAYCVRQLVNES